MKSKIFKSKHIKIEIRTNLDGKDILDDWDIQSAKETIIKEYLMHDQDIRNFLGIGMISIEGEIQPKEDPMKLPFKLP